MKTKGKNIVYLIVSTIFLLGAFSLFGYLFYNVRAESQSVSELSAQIEQLSNEESTSSTLKHSVAVTEGDSSKLNSYFVSSDNVVSFINSMEALGVNVGSDVSTTSIDPGKDSSTLTFNIVAKGSFSSVSRFVTLLENVPYQVRIQKLDLEKNMADIKTLQKGDKWYDWDATITLVLKSYIVK